MKLIELTDLGKVACSIVYVIRTEPSCTAELYDGFTINDISRISELHENTFAHGVIADGAQSVVIRSYMKYHNIDANDVGMISKLVAYTNEMLPQIKLYIKQWLSDPNFAV